MDMIGTTDVQESETMQWHGKTRLGSPTLKNNWLREWDIMQTPLYTEKGQAVIAERELDEDGNLIAEHPWSILTCTDNPSILIGAPFNPGSFRPLSNAEFLDLIGKSVQDVPGVKVASVLSCYDRGQISVSLSLAELESYKIKDREFEAFLNFSKGHDKKFPLDVTTSNICGVCANTVRMNLNHKGKLVKCRVKQTRYSRAEIENIAEVIKIAFEVQKAFAESFQALDTQEVKHSQAKAIFTGHLVGETEIDAPDFEVSTRTVNRVDRLLELFHDDSKGNHGRTLADAFSAVTDYYSHESAGGEDTWKQFVSSEYGSGNRAKQDFWSMINDAQVLAVTQNRGEKVLAMM